MLIARKNIYIVTEVVVIKERAKASLGENLITYMTESIYFTSVLLCVRFLRQIIWFLGNFKVLYINMLNLPEWGAKMNSSFLIKYSIYSCYAAKISILIQNEMYGF